MTEARLGSPVRPVAGANGGRPLQRRRPLPGGRAVVGGFLVALAAVGIFTAYTTATADQREEYLVASRDLTLGHRLTEADLAPMPMELPHDLQGRSYQDPSLLVGAVVIGPVAKGELLQASDVVARPGSAVGRELSFPIESARAVDGQLKRGELVDVLASYGTGTDAYTVMVMRGARVVDRSRPDRSLGGDADEVVTLAVPSRADALAMAHAVNAGAVTLVRSGEGADAGGGGDRTTYRAPGPEALPSPSGR